MTQNKTIKSWTNLRSSSFIIKLLKGSSQIMLQENAFTGFLFFMGIFYGSITMGFGALLAGISGTLTAILLKFNPLEINRGLYGFSAILVGVGVFVFLKPVVMSWFILVTGACLASILQNIFIKRNIPVFTLPFVLITWLIIYVSNVFFTEIMIEPSMNLINSVNYFMIPFKGYGQVIFQENFVSGLLFFLAVLMNSRIAAFYGLAGGVLSAFMVSFFSMPIEDIGLGLFSFNAVLCAITFSGNKIKDGLWSITSVILSVATSLIMFHFHLISLTFPFVLASCITLLFKKKLIKQ